MNSNKKKRIMDFSNIDKMKSDPKLFHKYYHNIFVICDELPYDFRKRLRYLRECSGMTREKLEETSYISVQTIKEIEINKDRGYSIETIVALCIGMKLPPFLSFELLKTGGFDIENTMIKKNCLYCFILRDLYNETIDDINNFLEINGLQALSIKK